MDALRSHVQPASERFEHEPPFRVGGAAIDPATREVTISGKTERIQPQPLRVLMLLSSRKGKVVTRDDIVEQCWDRRIVGDDVINRAILILRRLAGRAGGFRIDTIPRAGYRLVESGGVRRVSYKWMGVVISALLLALAGGLYLQSREAAASAPTISILPAVAASGGGDAAMIGSRIDRALADAIHESGFEAAAEREGDLSVSTEVAVGNGRTRVDVAVTAGPQRTIVMSRTFERPDVQVSDLELEVAAGVVEIIAATASLLTIDGRVAEPAFVSRMLAGMRAAAEGDALRSHQIAVRTARDYPNSVAAELALAITYAATLESFPTVDREARVRTARSILDRRREYAPRFGDFAHSWCILRPRVWLDGCERQLREALKVAETGNSSGQRLSELLADVGRTGEAFELARIASSENPYSAPDTGTFLQLLEIEGRHRQAEAVYADAIRKWPESWTLRWNRIMGLAARGDFALLERFAATVPKAEFTFDAEILQSALAAYRNKDRAKLIQFCTREHLRGSTRQTCIAVLAAVGELDRSFAMASDFFPKQVGRNAAEEEQLWLKQPAYYSMALLSAPAGAPLRRDPRFLELAQQTGLLRYWRSGRLPDFCTQTRRERVCDALRAPLSQS